jgi:hypothetical protein
MLDFAYNLSGEPFDVPDAVAGWRVRKLKAKSAPEVVYGLDGIPLVLPVDADMSDLRREVRAEGRYRLDAVDAQWRAVPGCPPGYVCVQPDEPAAPPTPVNRPMPVLAAADLAVLEAMRINAELARAVIDRFPMILESAAVLLRAADNAGMTRRPPAALEDVLSNGRDAEIEAQPIEPSSVGQLGILEHVVTVAVPAIVNAVLSGGHEGPSADDASISHARSSGGSE